MYQRYSNELLFHIQLAVGTALKKQNITLCKENVERICKKYLEYESGEYSSNGWYFDLTSCIKQTGIDDKVAYQIHSEIKNLLQEIKVDDPDRMERVKHNLIHDGSFRQGSTTEIS